MLSPKVDIIIPTYNRKEFLKRAVSSVYNQSYQSWNLFIIDDGSTDGASDEFHGKKTKILKWKNNKGVSYARNQGILKSASDWIAFLDSDDEWLPQKLEKQVAYIKNHPRYPLVHCNEIWLRKGKILNQKKKHKKQGGRIFTRSVRLCCISPSAVLVKRSLLKEVGLFREDFPVCEDFELWLRITARYELGFLEEPLLIKHGGHEDQLSKKYPAMDYWRLKALYPHLGNNNLSLAERKKVKETLIEKSNILLRGYRKHTNFTNQKEVKRMYQDTLSFNFQEIK